MTYILILLLWIVPMGMVFLISALSESWSDLKLDQNGKWLNIIPGISIVIIIYYTSLVIRDILIHIWEHIHEIPFVERIIEIRERRKKLKEELKQRDIKIKMGIIKITKFDPYGEENWNE